ncbi:hypothetical protein C6P42_000002 [Pichia californica]|nr:hypothetical protein C6P42_000002 [[Candida] californica]
MTDQVTKVIKKRKRGKGPFFCDFENCGKVFSRSDHLTRHQVNHSNERYICEVPGCGKEFTRLDVKKKHESSHIRKRKTSYSPDDGEQYETIYAPAIDTISKYDSPNELRGPTFIGEQYNNSDRNILDTNISPNSNILNYNNANIPVNDSNINNNSPMNLLLEIHNSNKLSLLSSPFHENITTQENEVTKDYTMNVIKPVSDTNTTNSPISDATGSRKSVYEKGILSDSSLNQSEMNDKDNLISPNNGVLMNNENISNNSNQNNIHSQIIENNTNNPTTTTSDHGTFYSTEMIQLLLGNADNVSPTSVIHIDQLTNGAFQGNQEEQIGKSTISVLEEVFAISPNFPSENNQTEIDNEIINKMIHYIPELKNNSDFTSIKIKWFLELYWTLYHCQYPILHRPSFTTHEAPSLLLLSMIMIGSSLAKKVTVPSGIILTDPANLAMKIAEPLRWLIFACDQARPPCKAWVIQSLIILETYEIISSSRALHERAIIYNGAKIQLLRRSPILGGDPFKSYESDTSRSENLWNTWIESESMKRAALMSFNLDTIHAVVFGHPMNIFANQIKLSLPCPDDIWEYKNVDRSKAPYSVTKTPLFLDALKSLLKNEPVNVDSFGRQIILSGLINLILQMEQNISQWTNFGWKTIEKSWKDDISSAIKFWKTQLPEGNCCLTLSSVYYAGATSPPLPPSLMPEDTRCKFPVYHAAQIYLKITHYDYIVFAGAPKRMNVPILAEDYAIVVKRIDKWSKSLSGKLSVINSLILLFEMLLSPEGSVDVVNYYYEPDKDPFIYRPNVIISAMLSLWSYAFHVFGPESLFKSPDIRHQLKSGFIPAMEDGSYYLRRIRTELVKKTGISFSSLDHMNPSDNMRAMKEYCRVLPEIKGLHHLIGILRTLETSYLGCEWQVGREYAKLLGNCIKRSAGAKEVFCHDMYDV